MTAHNIENTLKGLAEMEFANMADFNDGHAGAFWSGAPTEEGGSTSPWELHRDTDEFLMCVEGSVEIHVLAIEPGADPLTDDLTKTVLTAGEFVVVPKGHWHRHHATTAFREFYITPGPSDHSMEPDPR